MEEIRIIDTTLRDAHQCLWATRMETEHMMPVLPIYDELDYDSVDLMGTIQFDVAVRYLMEDPWERVRRVTSGAPNRRFRSLIRSKNLAAFDFLADDVIDTWVDRLHANGIRVIGAFDGLNDVSNIEKALVRAKSLGAYTFGSLSFCESPVHTDEHFIETTRQLIKRADVDAIMLKDAGGLLTVDRVRTLIPKLLKECGTRPLEIHSHCLTGLAPLVYLECAKVGCRQFHLATKPMANGAAQPATQTVVRNLRDMGFHVNLDLGKVDEIGHHFEAIAKREGKPLGEPMEYDAFHYKHQIPGGMLSNFREQLKTAGMLDRLPELLEECARVREELAWPIMITPYAQFVGTQAVMNVMTGERYGTVPNEVKKYALGHYGRLLGDVDQDVLDRIVENGSSDIPTEAAPVEPMMPELRRKYPDADDDELMLRVMFAGNQVDVMKNQRRQGRPSVTQMSLPDLLRHLASDNPGRTIHVGSSRFDLTVKTS